MRTILLLIFLCFNITARAQNTFEKVIDTLGCVVANCIQETFDGGYIFGGTSSYNGNDAMVVKLDSSGTIEWAKTYFGSGAEGVMYLEQTPDSGYMLNVQDATNAKTCLYRLNNIGDTLWTKSYSAGVGSTSAVYPNSMASVYNNVYGLTGYYSNGSWPSAFFIACLNNGFLLNSKVYNTAVFGNESNAISKTVDGGFIMTGSISNTSSFADIYLIRTNTYGDTLWTRHYDKSQTDAGQAVIQTTDSGFAIAAYVYNGQYNDIYLIKTDSIGDTLWTKTYNFYADQNPNSIQHTSDGGFIILGSVLDVSLGARKVYLIRTNPTGDTLWTRNYGGVPWTSHGYFVRQTMDGGFIISGSTGNFGTGTYIIKTDSMGRVNSVTGIAEINNSLQLDLFPNPSSGVFTVKVKGLPKSGSFLQVYNITSQLIYSCPLNNGLAERIDLSSYPSGRYMAVLSVNQIIASRKIIIKN
jgi:Secretion system C-terminal sorting domain